MIRRRLLLRLSLLAVLLAACAPATQSVQPGSPAATRGPVEPAPTLTAILATPAASTQPATVEPTPLPVATSRGPDLEATDPSTVSLASGGLQFVEFFRFT